MKEEQTPMAVTPSATLQPFFDTPLPRIEGLEQVLKTIASMAVVSRLLRLGKWVGKRCL
jgi:hypothetical protein